jgi:hypothetical protein
MHRNPQRDKVSQSVTQPSDIDALYGLEPVLDIAQGPRSEELEQNLDVQCPYCAESIPVRIDLSAGAQTYVEDCQVCCQPIQMVLSVDQEGSFDSLRAERMDR